MNAPQHRAYGAIGDPIHKSHLTRITGDFGCPKRFQYEHFKQSDHAERPSYAATFGTATHEAITHELDDLGAARAFLAREVEGAPSDDLDEYAHMVVGAVQSLRARARRIVAYEPGFIARLGAYWLSGHVDVVYEPIEAPGTLAIADWKTGAQKPGAVELAHSWEAGLYSVALQRGLFIPRGDLDRESLERVLIDAARVADDNEVEATYGEYPSAVHYVHLASYVPYARAGKRLVSRPEDMARFGYAEPTTHAYIKGDIRGEAWVQIALRPTDVRRLAARLRPVVGLVRFGLFYDRPGDPCTRCPFTVECLNDGYQSTDPGDQRQLRLLNNIGGNDRDY